MNRDDGRVDCDACQAYGMIWPTPAPHAWLRCAKCDGLGRVWPVGGPLFGYAVALRDRNVGEIVKLANGIRGKILWHMPRKAKGSTPTTTFLAVIDPFDDYESSTATAFDSAIGVALVGAELADVGDDGHGSKNADANDPVLRSSMGGLL